MAALGGGPIRGLGGWRAVRARDGSRSRQSGGRGLRGPLSPAGPSAARGGWGGLAPARAVRAELEAGPGSHIHTSPSCAPVSECWRQDTDQAHAERVSQVGFEVPYMVLTHTTTPQPSHTAHTASRVPKDTSRVPKANSHSELTPSANKAVVEGQGTMLRSSRSVKGFRSKDGTNSDILNILRHAQVLSAMDPKGLKEEK